MGDFNSQLGKYTDKERGIMGPFSYGKRNNNGIRLINFALEFNLTITNTLFKKKKNRKWNWVSPDGKTFNEIDFILTNKPRVFENIEAINTLNFNSDNRILRGTIKYNILDNFEKTIEQDEVIHKQDAIQTKYDIIEKRLIELGKKLKGEKRLKDTATEFYKILYNDSDNNDMTDKILQQDNIPSILVREV
ncbi:unnamed protein product [Leptosia nina]|uniref:Endonuclease/exonuclease/phosphatase domain-containing protein n=1 Tax=Leptosia nina TaxID=320188 RepID=A0AAV1JZK1_9NEOP